MKNLTSRLLLWAALFLSVMAAPLEQPTALAAPSKQSDCQSFTQTNRQICGKFLAYWQQHGGLTQQGYPLTNEFQEQSSLDNKTYTVQYFERAVFESHPENQAPYDVLLSQLGQFQYKQKYGDSGASNQQASRAADTRLFPETGKHVGGKFLAYWQQHGGLAQQGYPISEEFQETSPIDGKTYTVQYFERAVFELHAENQGTPYEVLLSQLGKYQLSSRYTAGTPDQNVQQWTVQGQASPQLAALDNVMRDFMQDTGTRAGTLAVSKNGQLLFAHAYTWATPAYPITQPSSLFRLASNSKAFTAAAISHAFSTGRLAPDTAVFPLLGITSPALPNQTPDPLINTITVQQLVDHKGGWDDTAAGSNYDPVFHTRDIAKALNLTAPPSKMDMARYMYGQPLQFTPGSKSVYSNFGYVLLGLVIEKVSGMTFTDYLKSQVLDPLAISDVYLGHTAQGEALPNEVSYDQPGSGTTALDPMSSAQLPVAYGGSGFLTETMDSGGGLVATATALTQLIHNYAVWGIGPRPQNGGSWWIARTGSMPGTSSLAESRSNGIDFAYILNTRNFPQDRLDALHDAIGNIVDNTPLP